MSTSCSLTAGHMQTAAWRLNQTTYLVQVKSSELKEAKGSVELHSWRSGAAALLGVDVFWVRPAASRGQKAPLCDPTAPPALAETVWGFVDERSVAVPLWTALPTTP